MRHVCLDISDVHVLVSHVHMYNVRIAQGAGGGEPKATPLVSPTSEPAGVQEVTLHYCLDLDLDLDCNL